MEFGSEKWFEAVQANSTFPSDFAFYVTPGKKISSLCLESNVKSIGNLKCRTLLQWSDAALIEVKNCKTPMDYYNTVNELKDIWS